MTSSRNKAVKYFSIKGHWKKSFSSLYVVFFWVSQLSSAVSKHPSYSSESKSLLFLSWESYQPMSEKWEENSERWTQSTFFVQKKIRPWQLDVLCSVCPSFNYKSHSMFLTVYVRLSALFLLYRTYNFKGKLFALEVLEAGYCDGTVPLCRQVWAAMFFL